MSFEDSYWEKEFQKADDAKRFEHEKKGMRLKGMAALANGFLRAAMSESSQKGFFVEAVEETKKAYQSLDDLEKKNRSQRTLKRGNTRYVT
jgi:hypothetical protein